MNTDTFSLADLSERTGIEPRTIRSYIERDLLPGASGRGRGATYDRDHLYRLLTIKKLRELNTDVTLDKLRQLLQHLSPEQIRDIATGALPVLALVDTDEPKPAGSALDYARTEMAEHVQTMLTRHGFHMPWGAAHSTHGPHAAARRMSATRIERLLDALSELARSAGIKRVDSKVQGEAWYRLRITPDIELSVRGPLDPDQLIQLQEIGDHLRHFFTKGTRP